jgi:hypothetical protein
MQQPFKVTIAFTDPSLEEAERDADAQNLLRQLNQLDEVESVARVPDLNVPRGSMGAGFLVGLLQAEVNAENTKKVLGFLGNRLSGKMIELEVEGAGKRLKVKARNPAELAAVIEEAKNFLDA